MPRRRALSDATPDDQAAALSAWCVDGKALRGAKDADGRQVRLLAVMEQEPQLVVGQAQLDKKSNEFLHPASRTLAPP